MSREPTPRERAARARRLAEVFGDVLPDQTRDERDDPATTGEREDGGADARLLREVPPHHG